MWLRSLPHVIRCFGRQIWIWDDLTVKAVVPAATALAAIIANQTALASVLVTAYNHPSFGQPVCAHADAQDTFIFQLEGCRVWNLGKTWQTTIIPSTEHNKETLLRNRGGKWWIYCFGSPIPLSGRWACWLVLNLNVCLILTCPDCPGCQWCAVL